MNFRYPVFLDVAGKRCLVIGEGPEIAAKVRVLAERGAEVIWHAREFKPGDLDGCFLVIAALEDNSKIFALAEERNVLCNAADDPGCCRFSFGSVVERGDLTIAISTNGTAPALAVRLRERLEKEIGAEYASFTAMLGELRAEITANIPDFMTRRNLWYRLVDSEALTLLRQGRSEEARQLLRKLVDDGLA